MRETFKTAVSRLTCTMDWNGRINLGFGVLL